jgi:hypothetical protein
MISRAFLVIPFTMLLGAAPKSSDFPIELLVKSATIHDQDDMRMVLEASDGFLYVKAEVGPSWVPLGGSPEHVFKPGTYVFARLRVRRQIEIFYVDEKGRPRTAWYVITQTDLK